MYNKSFLLVFLLVLNCKFTLCLFTSINVYLVVCINASPANFTFPMITWNDRPAEYVGFNLAANDVNGNSMILPDTFVDYSFVAHYLNPAVCLTSIIFVMFSYSIF